MKRLLCVMLAVTLTCQPVMSSAIYKDMQTVEAKSKEATTVAATMKLSAKTTKKTTVYAKATTSSEKKVVLAAKKKIYIVGELTVQSVKWYRIKTTVKGQTVKGYVPAANVKRYNMFPKTKGATNSNVYLRTKMSTSSKAITLLSAGTSVTAHAKTTKNGYTWYKISTKVNGKKTYGYVASQYVTLVTTKIANSGEKAGVSVAKVGIFKTANVYDQKLNTLASGQPVKIIGQLQVNGNSWYKVAVSIGGVKVKGYMRASKVALCSDTTYDRLGIGILKSAQIMRKIANPLGSKVKKLSANTEVTLEGYTEVGNTKWYKCSHVSYVGYIPASAITVKEEPDENDFEATLEAFPESYRDSLRALHETYPNWRFVAIDTALDWNEVVANENVVGRNVIQSNYPRGGSSLAPFSYLSTQEGAYNWATDTYYVKDGYNWYCAAEDVIKYYLDPRNFLNETGIYQFEALSFDTNQRKSVVTEILKNTFMSGKYSVVDKLTEETVSGHYNATFMTAGETSGASPYFLARTSRLELGANGSASVSGTYPGYEGIYNYYNIGAYDSSTGEAIKHGLEWASGGSKKETTYMRPWTNPYKSIVGGATYIAKNYINKGQNTSYFKKFNVVNYEDGLYVHQYYTNVQGAQTEASIAKQAYDACDISQDAMVFYIPVYDNMPATPCQLPAAKGNPNYYLKSITVTNAADGSELALDATFNYKTLKYTMVVQGKTKLAINAQTISKYASVTVNGTKITGSETVNITVKNGKTKTIKIVCTAGNGEKKTYKITVASIAQ